MIFEIMGISIIILLIAILLSIPRDFSQIIKRLDRIEKLLDKDDDNDYSPFGASVADGGGRYK